MIIDAVIFMSEFRIVLYDNDVNRRIVDLCFFGSSAQLPVCLLCQMIAFYVVEIGKVKEVYGVVIPEHSVISYVVPERWSTCVNRCKPSSFLNRRDQRLSVCEKSLEFHDLHLPS